MNQVVIFYIGPKSTATELKVHWEWSELKMYVKATKNETTGHQGSKGAAESVDKRDTTWQKKTDSQNWLFDQHTHHTP